MTLPCPPSGRGSRVLHPALSERILPSQQAVYTSTPHPLLSPVTTAHPLDSPLIQADSPWTLESFCIELTFFCFTLSQGLDAGVFTVIIIWQSIILCIFPLLTF